MRYLCCDERRLDAIRKVGALNAIAYLEVSDSDAPTPALRQRTLFVRLLQSAPGLQVANVVIAGGERVPAVGVEWVAPADALPAGEDAALVAGLEDPSTVLLVRTAGRGDFSRYVLSLVASAGSSQPPSGFDPILASVEFSFKVDCPSDFDCAPACDCDDAPPGAPAIDYLAKDYDAFRRADARPDEPAGPGLAASATRRTSASHSSSCSPTSPTSCPIGKTPSRPRRTSRRRVGARRCAATPGSSTTACTRAATRVPGSACG